MNNYFGCNFKRLINSYRVARAKELLDGKDCPVSELFSRCGFASKSVFYVAFKKSSWHDSPCNIYRRAGVLL
ncbi:helix-turn-helix domain-containing protein [Phocaeicola dorei]|nr:helix-turn-helix domain-containing protein [Phocaeicola dorei]